MDEEILKQIFDELFSALEPLEAQNAALLRFLKAKGIATDQELAPYLEEAGNASNVRWRAARVRTAALISSALKPPENAVEPVPSKKKEAPSPDQSAEVPNEAEEKSAQAQKAETAEKAPTTTKSKKTEQQPEGESPKSNPNKEAA